MESKHVWSRPICLLLASALFCGAWVTGGLRSGPGEVQADWSVRRGSAARMAIIRRRLKGMLEQSPFSDYALKNLMLLHKTHLARLHLVEEYRLRIRKSSKDLAARAILARLLMWHQDWRGALPYLEAVLAKRKHWPKARLALAKCLLGVGQKAEAIKVFRTLIPTLRGLERQTILVQVLKVGLRIKQRDAWRFALETIKKEPWISDYRLTIARILVRYGALAEGMELYKIVLKGLQGGRRVRLLLEVSRVALKGKRASTALRYLREAQKIKSLHSWFAWEMQMLEVSIYRAQMRLPSLMKKLSKKWKKSKELQEIFLLGKIQEELKDFHGAERWYKLALKFHPAARRPRQRLIGIYTQQGKEKELMGQLGKMIKYKVAGPAQYLQLAKHHMKRSQQYRLPRWNRNWAGGRGCTLGSMSSGYYRMHTDVFGRYYYYYYRLIRQSKKKPRASRYRCTRRLWNRYRKRRWHFWRSQLSTEKTRDHLKHASQILSLAAKRFPNDWESLQDMEEELEAFGMEKTARWMRSRLIHATEFDMERLSYMRDILRRAGEGKAFTALLKRLLKETWMRPAPAQKLAEYSYAPDDLTLQKGDSFLHYERLRKWEGMICPDVQRFLRTVFLRISPYVKKNKPFLVYKMSLLLWRCGEKRRWLKRRILALESRVLSQFQGPVKVMRFAIEYALPETFDRLLMHPRYRKEDEKVANLIQAAMTETTAPSHIYFIQKHLYKHKRINLLARLVPLVCQKKKLLCHSVSQDLQGLFRSKNVKPHLLFKAISAALSKGLFLSQRSTWSRALANKYWDNPVVINALAETSSLFTHPKELRLLHLRLMARALKLRRTTPRRLRHWRDMFKSYIYALPRWNQRDKLSDEVKLGMELLERAEVQAQRFPHLYRGVLAYYMYRYYYLRKSSVKRLKAWLVRNPQFEDIMLLRSQYSRIPASERLAFLTEVSDKTQQAAALQLLAAFAHSVGQTSVHITAFEKLLKLQPNNAALMRRLIDLLDRIPGHQQQADKYAIRWMKMQKKGADFPSLQRFAKRCCVDPIARKWGTRMLVIGLLRFGWKKMKPIWDKLQPRLKRPQLEGVLLQMKDVKSLPTREKRLMAALAYKHRFATAASALYGALDKQKKLRGVEYRNLAVSLDLLGDWKQADGVWRRFFDNNNTDIPETYFKKRARKLLELGKEKEALLSFYRMWRGKPMHSPIRARDQIARLQNKGDLLEARAIWLWMLKEKASDCFRTKGKSLQFKGGGARTLWRLGLPYAGPFLFFRRCQWTFRFSALSKKLAPIVKFLKKNPHQQVELIGSAAPNEPDAGFLARQRALALRNAMLSFGVPLSRVTVSMKRLHLKCGFKDDKKHKSECMSYQRQVAILPKMSLELDKKPAWHTFARYLKKDTDGDGVPDSLDGCPLRSTSSSSYSRYSWRRRYYYRRRMLGLLGRGRLTSMLGSSGTTTSHPYSQLYPRYVYRRTRRYGTKTRVIQRGCPRLYGSIGLTKVKNKPILTASTTMFSRRYSYLLTYGRRGLTVLSNLMRYAPYLGRIQVEVLIREKRYTYRTKEQVAENRKKAIVKYLRQTGVKKDRILATTVEPDPDLPLDRQRLVTFRMIDYGKLSIKMKKKKKKTKKKSGKKSKKARTRRRP